MGRSMKNHRLPVEQAAARSALLPGHGRARPRKFGGTRLSIAAPKSAGHKTLDVLGDVTACDRM
jgi:hypothetical protein